MTELYSYEVIRSESKDYPVGLKFITEEKMHDGRRKFADLADKECNDFVLKVLPITDEQRKYRTALLAAIRGNHTSVTRAKNECKRHKWGFNGQVYECMVCGAPDES